MRRAILATALLLAESCGGSSTSPLSPGPAPAPRAVRLESGAYTLTLTFSLSGLPTCQNGFCTSTSLCIGKPSSTTTSFDATVDRSGDNATVRIAGSGSSSMVLQLSVGAASVSGTIAGSARDATGVVIEASGTVTGAAPVNTAYAVSGNIDGQMSVPGGGCSNNGHVWALAVR